MNIMGDNYIGVSCRPANKEIHCRAGVVNARFIHVVLLGGAGCSGDQVATLRRWLNLPPESEWQDYDVMAIYADPIVGEGRAVMETLILRRASQASIPFFVSRDSTFSPRGSGLRTPQVEPVESGRITSVLGTLESPLGP